MSIIKRIFGKTQADPPAPATGAPAPSVPPAPRPDPVALAREEEARVSQAIAAGDAAAVARWVLEASSTRVRQLAARAVQDPGQLRELIRATRGGNDKNVYRILTATRDRLLAAERAEQQLRAELDATAAAIALLAERSHDALFEATLSQLQARWQSVSGHASAEQRAEVAAALQQAQAIVARHREAEEARAESRRAAARAAQEEERRREQETRASEAAAAERARAQQAQSEAARAEEHSRREAEAAARREVVGLLRQARAAIDEGGTARAVRLRHAIEEKRPQVTDLPPWFERGLHELDARIAEMKDWKTFTVVPKRADLLERMRSLVGADIAPEELARQIRRLRDEWRTLNRGAADDPSPEWQQFNEFAERAYEPCREHFARQAERRRDNQVRREAILERLAAFAERQTGEPVDWRGIQQVIGEARREWQEHAPVDQAVAKSLQDRFHAQLDELHGRLESEYARNVQARRDLIARAASLSALADTRQAIEEARNLQRAWKAVGIVPRQRDHALWEEFRKHCDAVFERSSQEFAARQSAREGQRTRAVELCEELERIGDPQAGADGLDVRQLRVLAEEFESLDLPRAAAHELRQRFARARSRCEEKAQQQRAAEAERDWRALFAAADHVRAYALAVARGGPDGHLDALRTAAESAVGGLDRAPKGCRAILERRLAQVAAGDVACDLAANEAALRMLCVRAESVAGIESPPEDQERRREYQLQRLVQSMQRGERASPAALGDLAAEWVAVGPVEAAVHESLMKRLERCQARR